jgi:hypothetical protein
LPAQVLEERRRRRGKRSTGAGEVHDGRRCVPANTGSHGVHGEIPAQHRRDRPYPGVPDPSTDHRRSTHDALLESWFTPSLSTVSPQIDIYRAQRGASGVTMRRHRPEEGGQCIDVVVEAAGRKSVPSYPRPGARHEEGLNDLAHTGANRGAVGLYPRPALRGVLAVAQPRLRATAPRGGCG